MIMSGHSNKNSIEVSRYREKATDLGYKHPRIFNTNARPTKSGKPRTNRILLFFIRIKFSETTFSIVVKPRVRVLGWHGARIVTLYARVMCDNGKKFCS